MASQATPSVTQLSQTSYEETHDANIASAVAGHSKTTITMNRYAHARQDAAVKGIKALDEVYSM